MKTIIIAFTLKGQDFGKIERKIEEIAGQPPTPTLLIHGFLPRKVLLEKNIPTIVIDALDKYFPIQLNMYADGKPLRNDMAILAKKLDAVVHVIGEIKEGVLEEVQYYQSFGVSIQHHEL